LSPKSGELGVTPNHKRTFGTHASTSKRHLAKGLIGSDGDIGGSKGKALRPAHKFVSEAAPLEFSLVEFGVQVMVIEDEPRAEEFEEEPNQENRVGWITCLEDAEAGSSVNSQGEQKFSREGPTVLSEIAEYSGGFPNAVTVDLGH
jgi:hypothetical protein